MQCTLCGKNDRAGQTVELVTGHQSATAYGNRVKITYSDFQPMLLFFCQECITKKALGIEEERQLSKRVSKFTLLTLVVLSILAGIFTADCRAWLPFAVVVGIVLLLIPARRFPVATSQTTGPKLKDVSDIHVFMADEIRQAVEKQGPGTTFWTPAGFEEFAKREDVTLIRP